MFTGEPGFDPQPHSYNAIAVVAGNPRVQIPSLKKPCSGTCIHISVDQDAC